MVRQRLTRFLWVAVVAIVIACGPPKLEDVEGRSFTSVTEFQQAVSCSQFFNTYVSYSGQPPVIDDENEALERARSFLDGSQPTAVEAVEAGKVWLLVDDQGLAFAAMDSVEGSIGGCMGY